MLYAVWLVLPAIVGIGVRRRAPQARWSFLILGIILIVLGLTSCGASTGGGGGGGEHHTTTYTVTVLGASGSINHSLTVDLLVTQ